MKTLVKVTPLVLILFSATVIVSADNITSPIPYDIPGGIVNDIRTLYDPDEGFVERQVQKFPEYYYNYTAEGVDWLEIGIGNQTGARPVIHVNGESVYAQMDPFIREKVIPGDFFEVQMVPPRVLESSHDIVQNNEIITRYKVYSWDDMSGLLLFTLIPRAEINPDFTYSPEIPVEDGSLKFTALGGTSDMADILWDLRGPGLSDDGAGSRYLSPRLWAGDYKVTLTLVDVFGYSANITKTFQIQSETDGEEPESGFTHLEVSNVTSPSSSLINEGFDVNLTLVFLISGPREIRLRVIDVESGAVLSSVEDLLETNGSKSYHLSLVAYPVPRPMILRVDVFHNEAGTWVISDSSPAFTLDLDAPGQSNRIPGFPVAGILMGVIGVFYLNREQSPNNPENLRTLGFLILDEKVRYAKCWCRRYFAF